MKKVFITAILLCITLLCACSPKAPENTVLSADELNGRSAGALSGSPAESYVKNTGAVLCSYDDKKLMLDDLVSGRLDCIAADKDTADSLMSSSKRITKLDDPLAAETYRIVVARENPDLTEDINKALKVLENSKKLGELLAASLSYDETASDASATDFETSLTVAVDPTFPPYCYRGNGGEICGFEAEVARAVCRQLGLGINFLETSSDKLVSSVQTGRAAFAIGRLTESSEAAADFTDTYMSGQQVVLVRK